MNDRRVLVVVMDGVGAREERFGNAVQLAWTPAMEWLKRNGIYTTLKAHGTAVGMPSDTDLGNSEVGHNALGAGRVFAQGASLVGEAIDSERMFAGKTWRDMLSYTGSHEGTLHFLGLLSDGNVHAHERYLYAMLARAKADGVRRVRVHALLDGRDVGEKSAETYVSRLERTMAGLRGPDFDVLAASGGGRMRITMDRYEADWSMVQRGWRVHVLGEGQGFPSLTAALHTLRRDTDVGDQNLPEFVITGEHGQPAGQIHDGDAVVFFNFRGDRAIEISRAFCDPHFPHFDRVRRPKVYFAGMMLYDGDLAIPENYLVSPPVIDDTLSEFFVERKVRQFACSETQKFGHVTYFWNGNRSGYVDRSLEEYLQIPSDEGIGFNQRPWMKAAEIVDATVVRMQEDSFDAGRINLANGDMVGHTGDLPATVVAVSTLDMMLGRLIRAADATGTILLVTADHGNCDDMLDARPAPGCRWESLDGTLPPKTSHSLSPVPFYVYDPRGTERYRLRQGKPYTLANVANTVIQLMGLDAYEGYEPGVIARR